MQGREASRFSRSRRGSHLVKVKLQSLDYSSRYKNSRTPFTCLNHKRTTKILFFYLTFNFSQKLQPKVPNMWTKYNMNGRVKNLWLKEALYSRKKLKHGWKMWTSSHGEIPCQDSPMSTTSDQTTTWIKNEGSAKISPNWNNTCFLRCLERGTSFSTWQENTSPRMWASWISLLVCKRVLQWWMNPSSVITPNVNSFTFLLKLLWYVPLLFRPICCWALLLRQNLVLSDRRQL